MDFCQILDNYLGRVEDRNKQIDKQESKLKS